MKTTEEQLKESIELIEKLKNALSVAAACSMHHHPATPQMVCKWLQLVAEAEKR